MIVKIFTNSPDLDYDRFTKTINERDFIIATDKAALRLIEERVQIDLAIGDFDSVTSEQLDKIKKHVKHVMVLKKDKDMTDTKAAVDYALELNCSEIIIYATASGRYDHFYSMINLLINNKVRIISNNNRLYILEKGTHNVNPIQKYVSFFAFTTVDNLTLEGFKYPLNSYSLVIGDPICTSNEGSGVVSFDRGKLLVIESSDE